MTDVYATLDLGSNSFHLLVVRKTDVGVEIVERLKDKVQLLADFADGRLQTKAIDRGLRCLTRFAQRLSSVPRDHITVMGTSALRQADNSAEFCDPAAQILGVRVQIISGQEEARLIYLGVSRLLGDDRSSRLVVDVGGGSTEFAVGRGSLLQLPYSINLGCVSLTDRFFRDPDLVSATYLQARDWVINGLADVQAAGISSQAQVIGTSGSVESVLTVLEANGWGQEVITAEGLQKLDQAIVNRRWVLDAGLPGLLPERTDIFPAGLAIVSGIFAALGLQEMHFVDAQLMQGMLVEALSMSEEADVRGRTVADLSARFMIDVEQAQRVCGTVTRLHQQTQSSWWQDDTESRDLLAYAAELHEIGLAVSAAHYHRHGAYVLANVRLRGFSKREQRMLSALVRNHRRAFSELSFRSFALVDQERLQRMAMLLRIAVILQRGHADWQGEEPSAVVRDSVLYLDCAESWLDSHALSVRELQVEIGQFARAAVQLVVRNASTGEVLFT